jgi:uncharacterized membrane protein YhiD involved in acid resistance
VVAAVGLAVGGDMFDAARVATFLALALLALARPVEQWMFPNRKQRRRVMSILDQGAFPAKLSSEVDAADVHPDQIVVRPYPTDEI